MTEYNRFGRIRTDLQKISLQEFNFFDFFEISLLLITLFYLIVFLNGTDSDKVVHNWTDFGSVGGPYYIII